MRSIWRGVLFQTVGNVGRRRPKALQGRQRPGILRAALGQHARTDCRDSLTPSPSSKWQIPRYARDDKPTWARRVASACEGYFSLTPCSAKYFAAPGWKGIGEAAAFWFSSLKFSASLCTAIMSSRLSKMVLTML